MELKTLPSTNPAATGSNATWSAVTGSPNSASNKNPLDVSLLATNAAGRSVTPSYTAEGHAEVAIHSPRNPFGSLHVETLHPVFQTDAVYGLNPKLVTSTVGRAIAGASSGVTTAANNMLDCSTGTIAYSFATIQSRRRLRYRPGQGVVGRFAGLFPNNATGSINVAGFGTSETGYLFGYNGTSFGILHSTGGVREIRDLTITTASTSTTAYVVGLPSGTNVTVTGATAGNQTRVAYELSLGTYPGWKAKQVGSVVRFLADGVGTSTGSLTFSQPGAPTPAAGNSTIFLTGVASTDTWIPQSSWNTDTMNGSGDETNPSGVLLDPAKGNVYEIGVQYLGFGSVEFKVEANFAGRNNPDFIVVHNIKNPNTRTTPHASQPSFPFTMTAYSSGSTVSTTVKVSSFAGFIEGLPRLIGPRSSYTRETNGFVGAAASTYYPLFTIRNGLTFGNRANQSVVRLKSMCCTHDDATPVTFALIRNATLGGTPSFTQFSTTSSTYIDTAATTATYANNDQLEISVPISQSSGDFIELEDEMTLQPGETITLAARAVTGVATYVLASLNTREDQ